MQRWCAKLSLSLAFLPRTSHSFPCQHRRLLNSSAYHTSDLLSSVSSHLTGSKTLTHPFTPATSSISCYGLKQSHFPGAHLIQLRNFSQKSKDEKWNKYKKKWTQLTPATSKVKKTKMKAYSSYKGRFRVKSDGTIKRWREGKQHNAHSKSKSAKRRLRRPSTVPLAYAKVMKKLNFCAA